MADITVLGVQSVIVSGSRDYTIRLWDARQGGESLSSLEGHTGEVSTVQWHSNGFSILSAGRDNQAKVRIYVGQGLSLWRVWGVDRLVSTLQWNVHQLQIVKCLCMLFSLDMIWHSMCYNKFWAREAMFVYVAHFDQTQSVVKTNRVGRVLRYPNRNCFIDFPCIKPPPPPPPPQQSRCFQQILK